ncbi:MAG: enoyl-CoA hydratase/isomerase family protein [Desulfobacula sp.]|jgi:enoyl-CoA hydratase/carnithine racemase|uniref:enoyl-CoA hydratase/isomerase family protein n=1 Tax=Desulfobacula sp. TaxID=2593537 RepID=UPI001D3AB881|nr:enoyl-CoA hydratase/isomerase family protein [Desulfobacula sp.]MBT3484924.1 enoyl-CoA hydratase/isomerase family protein [Desulfobacula sp.]MBT3803240.1 enoyl-CoA hydratase/isomerase family protein [Desulfobacula sp.]MBT4024623.1 enoyl-CoA hydratase/isomerase family protein [Desulfobacula sp.]MBT4197553.1 enoyl-CoA hydratase/isomerase family protein [Desulfobacula sp.]
MENETVLYHCNENVGIITLNRPHRLNAINIDLLKGFMAQLDRAKQDTNARVIILTGAGTAFCAGEDLKDTASGKSFEQWVDEAERLQEIQRMTMKLGKPIIAAVPGYALGGGSEYAMGCDIRIAAETAVFGFPETTVGMTVTNAGTKILTHLVGLGKAKELIFTGDFIDAAEALKIGLVNKVVPLKNLMDESMIMAKKIASRSPLAVNLSRTAIDQGMEASFDQILELEKSHLLICAQSGTEFVEKRLKEMDKK